MPSSGVFLTAINRFWLVQEAFSMFGAADTEPRAVMSQILIDLYDGRGREFNPQTSMGWQLFSDMEGVDVVAGALHGAADVVIQAAAADQKGLVQYVKDNRWR